jgi:hypothetical protein
MNGGTACASMRSGAKYSGAGSGGAVSVFPSSTQTQLSATLLDRSAP